MTFETMRLFFGLLTVGANLAVLGGLVLLVPGLSILRSTVRAQVSGREAQLALVVALTATLGSLYLSEVAHLVPCTYCWYQRIAMYPLAVILGIAVYRRDDQVSRYVLPLAAAGGLIAIYHYTIQRVPALQTGSCSTGVPCSTAYFEQFGFMSIPYMAASAFVLIAMLMMVSRRPGPATRPQGE